MEIIITIGITLIVTLMSMVLLIPVVWRMVKYIARATESVANFMHKLRKSVNKVFGEFKKPNKKTSVSVKSTDKRESELTEDPELDNRIIEMRQAGRRNKSMLSAKHNISIPTIMKNFNR